MPDEWQLVVQVMDPLLRAFRAKLSSTVFYTCADDGGMASRGFDELCLICTIFFGFEKATNLHFKLAWSKIILRVFKLSGWTLEMLIAWLRSNAPKWNDMLARSSSKYLRFFLDLQPGRINGGTCKEVCGQSEQH